MFSRSTRTVGAAGVVALALVVVQVALAESPVSRFTTADQAAAKAVVLKAGDLAAEMKGGLEKNAKALSGGDCPGLWEPKQSDLVITGVAKSEFTGAGVRISSAVQIYETARMAQLDWERTVVHPAVVPCYRKTVVAADTPNFHVVSVKRTPFPRIGRAATRLRVIADITSKGSGEPVRFVMDEIAFGRGRTGIAMTLWAPYTDRVTADAAEVRLAKILVGRIRA